MIVGEEILNEDRVWQMKMFDSSKRLRLKAPLSKNGTFKIEIEISENWCLAIEVMGDNWLWHQRYGHLNFKSLQMWKCQNMVQGLPQIQISKQLCEECCHVKQHRNTFTSEIPIRSSKKLKINFFDICCHFEEILLGGNIYFVSFIDEFRSKTWICLIKRKSELFDVFKGFKLMVEKKIVVVSR